MKTKLHYVFSTTIFLIVFSAFGQNNIFNQVSKSISQKSSVNQKNIDKGLLFEFDYAKLHGILSNESKKNNSTKTSDIIISFPNTGGELEKYRIEEASVMSPDLQVKYPEIKSYIGYGVDSQQAYLRFSLSPYKGLSGIILGKSETVLFEPNSKNTNQIKVLSKSSLEKKEGFKCLTENTTLENSLKSNFGLKDADDSLKRTYKIAISVTGEYATYHGGTLALVNAAIAATLTNINAVFENDFNVSLQLVATNDDVIYLDSSMDPYGDTSNNYSNELQSTLDGVILDANYDIGHLLSAVGSVDGNSGCIGCVCISGNKGRGYTSDATPGGFTFDIDLVAHEIGHQFGANHTWTHDGNEGADVQMEPGSGSTIMGYAGITGPTDVQQNSDPYFHAISIEQITTYIKSTSCATVTNTGNTTPTVNAGSDLTLPIGTPFKLVGVGSDIDGDNISFCWEQINEDDATTTYPNPNSGNSNSVLFRSFSPTTDNTRYFPNLSDLKFGLNSTQWEKVPNINRTADFRLTVRDNKPGGANNTHDDMRVTFDNSYGPFEITSQNTPGIEWTSGSSETITWNVNNTNSLLGASDVNILLSTDGGVTYNVIVNNIPNNGSYSLTVPNTPAPYCRIMVEPTNHNFFAINSEDFTIDYTISEICMIYASTDSNLPLTITDNTNSINETSSLDIADSGTITDVNVTVNITHDWPGDITMTLESPNNTVANILTSFTPCQGEDINIITTLDDDAIEDFNCNTIGSGVIMKPPTSSLNSWINEDLAGQWVLGLGDYGLGDEGTLNSWSVEICYNTATPLNINEFGFKNFKVFPNPNKGAFTIKLNDSLSNNINIDIYDMRNRNIYKNKFFNDKGIFNESINLTNVQSGMYILNVSDDFRNTSKKIIIE